ncbi:MAG: hypothetical protein MI922_25610 [Bacteroidales bacterium]|nr:hypothetical protein [Bacteroidales bacterium]
MIVKLENTYHAKVLYESFFMGKDTALLLKERVNKGDVLSFSEANEYLEQSVIFKQLLKDFEPKVLDLLWRLTQLSEIPFASKKKKKKKWLEQLIKLTYTKEGFTLTGKPGYLLPCYNAMITSVLIKLNCREEEKIRTGIDWIVKYQPVERNHSCSWKGSGALKYGGCIKAVPCYIGLVKSMIALSDYKRLPRYQINKQLEEKLATGLEYILAQKVYQKQSDGNPITNYITKLTFPFTYKTNIIEILRLLKENDRINDTRCNDAKEFLSKKQRKDGMWQTQSVAITKNQVWVSFDKIRLPGEWISNEIRQVLSI